MCVYVYFLFYCFQHFQSWPRKRLICVHAEAHTMAAVILLAELYKRHVHVCHVARKEEVRVTSVFSVTDCNVESVVDNMTH